ncbi:roadblock/LC7 domain-containing protein [Micromonospora sp. NPDC003197]
MYLDDESGRAIQAELAALRDHVAGVLGCVLAGVDGLLILNDAGPGIEPHDIAAMAAATVGLSRQFSRALDQGVFQECTVRSTQGHFAVYSVGEWAVLAVRATEGLNIARLHLEARAMAARIARTLETTQWYGQS